MTVFTIFKKRIPLAFPTQCINNKKKKKRTPKNINPPMKFLNILPYVPTIKPVSAPYRKLYMTMINVYQRLNRISFLLVWGCPPTNDVVNREISVFCLFYFSIHIKNATRKFILFGFQTLGFFGFSLYAVHRIGFLLLNKIS